MKLSDYAESSAFVKFSDGEPRIVSLGIPLGEFLNLETIRSEVFDSEQFEIPILIWDVPLEESQPAVIATRSKKLIGMLVNFWDEDPKAILRVQCSGSGYRATYTVTLVSSKKKKRK